MALGEKSAAYSPALIGAGSSLRGALTAAGDRILVYVAGSQTTRTGAELLLRSELLAGALIDAGHEGARVGIYMRNGAAVVEAFIAAELIGGTRLPVEPSAAVTEAAGIFAAGNVDVVLTDHGLYESQRQDGHLTPFSSELSTLTLFHDDLHPFEGVRWTKTVYVDPDQLLMLYPRAVVGGELYGVPTSYANWNAYMATNQELYRSGGYGTPLGADECYLTALQLMHVAGHVGSFPFLHLGLPQVLVPRFNAKVVVDEIDAHQVTTMFAVPGMLNRMADEVDGGGRPRLGSLRRVLYGGAPVETDEIKRYVRVFGPTLSQLYGRYEAGWPLTVLDPADHARLVLGDAEVVGSCGRAIGAVEVELGAAGFDGRREVRSRSGMASAAFVDLDRWCGLGDTGMFTEHGYLHLTGRLDGMINSGAFHVYPDEVREAILGLPGVSGALVVGEPDPAWGEAVVAYVVSTDPKIADTLRGALRDRLAAYKIPTVVHLVESLPGAAAE